MTAIPKVRKVGAVDEHQHAAGIAPISAPVEFTVAISEFLGEEDEADQPEEMLVECLLPEGVVVFLAGEPKTAKTFQGLYMAICVAAGLPLFGRLKSKQGAVVVICEEDTAKQLRRRIWWLARGLNVDPRTLPIRIAAMRGSKIEEDAWRAQIAKEATGAKLIVLDALTRIHGLDENSRTDMQRVTRGLTELATSTGATVVVLHHYKKPAGNGADAGLRSGQKMRGTGDLYALARAIIGVSKEKDGTLKLDPESNYFQGDPFAVALSVEPGVDKKLEPGQKRRAKFTYVGQAREADDQRADDAVLRAYVDAAEPLSMRELRAAVPDLDDHQVDAAHRRMARAGTVAPIRYRPHGNRQASDRWLLASRMGEFEVAE
jgi:RecA-family ATPase